MQLPTEDRTPQAKRSEGSTSTPNPAVRSYADARFWSAAFGVIAIACFSLTALHVRPRFLLVILGSGMLCLSWVSWIVSGVARRDVAEGVITEKCYVKRISTIRLECLHVATSHGTIVLVNRTGVPGRDLVEHWVLLTYLRNNTVATEVRILADADSDE